MLEQAFGGAGADARLSARCGAAMQRVTVLLYGHLVTRGAGLIQLVLERIEGANETYDLSKSRRELVMMLEGIFEFHLSAEFHQSRSVAKVLD